MNACTIAIFRHENETFLDSAHFRQVKNDSMSNTAAFCRIFLVEDSKVIRDSLIEHIEELLPAEVVAWDHSEHGSVKWLKDNPDSWDVAVVDIFLTQGNGLGIACNLVDRAPEQKVVMLSNYATPEMRERCLALGVDAIFDKSNELDEFTVYMLTALKK